MDTTKKIVIATASIALGMFIMGMGIGLNREEERADIVIQIPGENCEKKETTSSGEVVYKIPIKEEGSKEILKIGKNIKHIGYADESIVQKYVQYAYEKCGYDMHFVALINSESPSWDPQKQAHDTEMSYGFCQMNYKRYARFIDDKRFFTDWARQLDRCCELYKGGTKFYGNRKDNIKWFKVR